MSLQSGAALDPIANYRGALQQYASEARIAGIGFSSRGVPLQATFIEPLLEKRIAQESSAGKSGGPELGLEILRQTRRIAVLGEPGEGKTSLLRRYAIALAQDSAGLLPVLVEFRRYRAKVQARGNFGWLSARLPDVLNEGLEGEGGWEKLCARIERGTASLLLDGFDELTPDAQQQVQELIPRLVLLC